RSVRNPNIPVTSYAHNHATSQWASLRNSRFGLNVAGAVPGWDSGATELLYPHFTAASTAPLGAFTPGYSEYMTSWKIWHGLSAVSGTTIATHKGSADTQPPMPALQIKNLGSAKTAVNTFGLGDVDVANAPVPP